MMHPRAWLLPPLAALAALCLPAVASEVRPLEPGSKIALIVGNARYVHAVPLRNAGNDASDMCAALEKLGFEVICKLDIASKRAFKDAIFEFTGKVTGRSVALFYFAGHGMQVDGLNYLLPTGADLRTRSDIEDEGIQVNYLMNELDARQAALNIFFLDACRNNPFTDPIRGYAPMMGMASQLYTPRNAIVAMSAAPGQLSLDGEGRNGTFTRNLLQHIGTPRQPVEEMLKAVNGGTRVDAGRSAHQQDPQLASSFTEKFCMAGCADAAPAVQTHDTQRAAVQDAEALETARLGLLKKQAELEAMRKALAVQKASIDAGAEEIRTRAVKPPEKKAPPPIVPVF